MIEEVQLRRVDPELGLPSLLDCAGRSEASDDRNALSERTNGRFVCELFQLTRRDPRRVDSEVSVGIGSERLEDLDPGLEDVTRRWECHQHRVVDVLGRNADALAAPPPALPRLEAPAHFP